MNNRSDIRSLMDEILRVSNLGVVEITPDYKGALIGFLARCRLLLYALTKMVDGSIDDAGDALTRSTYEHTVTALWMLHDPATNYPRLRQGYVHDWRKIREDHHRLSPGRSFTPERDVDELLAQEPNPQPLPSLPERARAANLEMYYVTYRLFCSSVHGTLAAAALGLDRRPEMKMRRARLGLAGRMVLRLTEATRGALGMHEDPEIARLTAAVIAAAGGEGPGSGADGP